MTPSDPVTAFERAFAARVGQPHAVSVTYARLGLRLLLEALGLRPGDEVIVPALTCRVVVLAIQSTGCRPVYADLLSSGALNLDAASVARQLTPRTRAIVFQHTYGTSAGLDAVADIAGTHSIPLIEDCAQCLPPASNAPGPGARGIASIWSYNFRKPMPAGAGGSVVTSDEHLASLVRQARDRGPVRTALDEFRLRATHAAYQALMSPATYWILWSMARRLRGDQEGRLLQQAIREEVMALPMRVSPRQAEWGLRGLTDADRRVQHADELARLYDHALRGVSTVRQVPGAVSSPLYYYPVLATDKNALLDAARRQRLELVAWPLTTPIYPVESASGLAQCEYTPGSCPVAELRAAALCGLPVDLMTTRRGAQNLIDLIRVLDTRTPATAVPVEHPLAGVLPREGPHGR